MSMDGPNLQTLLTCQLVPNHWNPNQMSDEQFDQLVAEVRRLGRLPKPIVVRALDDGTFEIIDGEHGWRAAREAGFDTILCEVIEGVDNFEAMRQTLARNSHGTHHRVREARVYEAMMQARGLSARQLSKQVGVSDKTIGNALLYLRAVDVRNSFAVQTRQHGFSIPPAEETVAGLTIRQVRAYLDLPDGLRDTWLDSGADIKAVKDYYDDLADGDEPRYPRLEQLASTALWAGVSMQCGQFRKSLRLCLRLLDTYVRQDYIPDLDEYLVRTATYNLDAGLVEALPIDPTGPRVLLDLATWDAIMSLTASCEFSSPAPQVDYARAQVHAALDRAGIDKTRAINPETIEQHRIVAQGPDFIRDATYLTLKEKVDLIQYAPTYPDDVVNEAKHRTVEELRRRRVERKGLWAGYPRGICSNILDDMHGGVSLADCRNLRLITVPPSKTLRTIFRSLGKTVLWVSGRQRPCSVSGWPKWRRQRLS